MRQQGCATPFDPTDRGDAEEYTNFHSAEQLDPSEIREPEVRPQQQVKQRTYQTEYIPVQSTLPNSAKVFGQRRKWNGHFDGKDLYSLLKRIQELQRAYQLSDAQVLEGFLELLRDDAQLCYRNIAADITTWAQL